MDKPFRTNVDVTPTSFGLNYLSPSLFLGSCFAQNIGDILQQRKFPDHVNPFGVLYNPVSVEMALSRIAFGELLREDELIFHNDLWLSFLHHTSFSNPSKEKCLVDINSNLANTKSQWQKTEHVVVTFGTARVYYSNQSKKPVANCHKIPASEFDHRLLSVSEIVDTWSNLLTNLLLKKPNLKVAFTISPIRHWKDGATGNLLSKSTLVLAVNELLVKFPMNTYYFPAYEIMLDDLRDYRFYADDMLHPSNMAVRYIWEKYSYAFIADSAKETMGEVEKVIQAINHRPLRKGTKDHEKFVDKTVQQMCQITLKHPTIDFSREIKEMRESLK